MTGLFLTAEVVTAVAFLLVLLLKPEMFLRSIVAWGLGGALAIAAHLVGVF